VTSVVVVGGGIAGLAAAHELVGRGAHVTLVEKDERVGGKLRTSPFAGRLVDDGADAFLLRVPEALDLCREVGLADGLVHPAARTAYIWSRGELHPMPPQLMGVPTDLDALEESGLLSPAGLARAREDLTAPPTPLDDDEAIATAIARRLGDEVVERLVDPLVGGINAGDTRALSLAAVVPQLDAALRDPDHASLIEACRARAAATATTPIIGGPPPVFASPAGGMGQLPAAVVAGLGDADVRTGRAVVGLEPTAGRGWRVAVDDGTSLDADAVVLAAPGPITAGLLEPLPGAADAARLLAAVEYVSVAIVVLALPLDHLARPLDRSGFLVPRVEETQALTACSWSSTKWAHLAPEAGDGTAVVRASAGRAGDERALELDDTDLVARLLADLERTMGLTGAPTEVRVNRWPSSFPQYAPGHLDRVAQAEAALPPGLALAGAALRGVGVPACIRSGRAAATRALVAAEAGG
jgi:oxygen-dependent protoporphyrinogen oxidase